MTSHNWLSVCLCTENSRTCFAVSLFCILITEARTLIIIFIIFHSPTEVKLLISRHDCFHAITCECRRCWCDRLFTYHSEQLNFNVSRERAFISHKFWLELSNLVMSSWILVWLMLARVWTHEKMNFSLEQKKKQSNLILIVLHRRIEAVHRSKTFSNVLIPASLTINIQNELSFMLHHYTWIGKTISVEFF